MRRQGGWREGVLARIGADGCWSEITADVAQPPAGAQVLAGALLRAGRRAQPRLPARLRRAGERRETAPTTSGRGATACTASRWRITPEQLHAVAAQLYVELLAGGYTQVCEFHYLQHDRDGRPYEDPLALSWHWPTRPPRRASA